MGQGRRSENRATHSEDEGNKLIQIVSSVLHQAGSTVLEGSLRGL